MSTCDDKKTKLFDERFDFVEECIFILLPYKHMGKGLLD